MRHIVCFSGTTRPDNYTALALAVVADELETLGEVHTVFDARDLDLSFPGDAPTPDAVRIRDAVEQASGVIFASPEYHGSICAYTKLIIENLGFPSVLAGKPVALTGVAAGRIGAIKSLEQLKGVCSHVGAIVVPGAISIAGVQSVFDEDGNCIDKGSENALRSVARGLAKFLDDFVCPRFRLEEIVRSDQHPWVTSI